GGRRAFVSRAGDRDAAGAGRPVSRAAARRARAGAPVFPGGGGRDRRLEEDAGGQGRGDRGRDRMAALRRCRHRRPLDLFPRPGRQFARMRRTGDMGYRMKLPAGTKLVVATHNAGKLAEIGGLIGPFGLEAVSAGALGLPEPEETGVTFEENALIKAE